MIDDRQELFRMYARMFTPSGLNSAALTTALSQFQGRWLRHLPKNHEVAILDLGCGTGEWLLCLQSLVYNKTYGVDLCHESLRAARTLGVPNTICADAVEFLQGSCDKFDLITAFNFCEHLPKPELIKLLTCVSSALKSGGRFLAVTPNALSPFSGATRYWDITHELAFTPASWRQLARLTGFASVAFEEYGPLAHSIRGAVRCALWQLIKLAFDAISLIEVGRPRDQSRVYTADMKIILGKAVAET